MRAGDDWGDQAAMRRMVYFIAYFIVYFIVYFIFYLSN
jgi:hypothetical protein